MFTPESKHNDIQVDSASGERLNKASCPLSKGFTPPPRRTTVPVADSAVGSGIRAEDTHKAGIAVSATMEALWNGYRIGLEYDIEHTPDNSSGGA